MTPEQESRMRFEMLQNYHNFLLERGASVTIPTFEEFSALSVPDQQRMIRDLRDLSRTPPAH